MAAVDGWIVIVDIDPLWRVELVSALRGRGVEAHAYDRYPDALRAIEALDPDAPALVVFGPSLSMRALADAATTPRPERVATMAIRPSVSVEDLQHAMRAGALDVRTADEPLPDLVDAVLAAAHHAVQHGGQRPHITDPASRRAGRLIMVCGAKGGVGVTTVALNLASGLAAARPGRVVLADGDPQFGDVAHRLGTLPADDPPGTADIDALVRHRLRRHDETGLLVLATPPSAGPIEAVPRTVLIRALTDLQALADVIVIDVPAPVRDELEVMRSADELVLVCRSDQQSARHAAVAYRLLDDAGLASIPATLVVNDMLGRGMSSHVIAGIVGLPVTARLPPEEKAVPAALADLISRVSSRSAPGA
jgi:MinD-like ATPase involved in chromosome partitioning or flagellar assembly/CheY-like chemotaxis protein